MSRSAPHVAGQEAEVNLEEREAELTAMMTGHPGRLCHLLCELIWCGFTKVILLVAINLLAFGALGLVIPILEIVNATDLTHRLNNTGCPQPWLDTTSISVASLALHIFYFPVAYWSISYIDRQCGRIRARRSREV